MNLALLLASSLLLPALADGPPAPAQPAPAGELLDAVLPGQPAPRPAPAADDARQWDLTPYVWATAMEGSTTVKGNSVNVDLSFGDILDHLDLGLMGHLEGRTREDSVFFDAFYASLGAEEDVAPGIEADLDQELWIVEFGGGVVLGDPPAGDGTREERRIEAIGGLRYWRIDADLDVPTVFSGGGDEEWLDPFVGLRALFPLGESTDFAIRGDLGGFGVGSQSSYNLMATLFFDVFENGRLAAGYRVLDADYDDGDGANEFEFDARLKGPFVGLTFRF